MDEFAQNVKFIVAAKENQDGVPVLQAYFVNRLHPSKDVKCVFIAVCVNIVPLFR